MKLGYIHSKYLYRKNTKKILKYLKCSLIFMTDAGIKFELDYNHIVRKLDDSGFVIDVNLPW